MGDRCYLSVTVHSRDAARLLYTIDANEYPDDEKWAELLEEYEGEDRIISRFVGGFHEITDLHVYTEIEEVNYGAWDGIGEAGAAGLVFIVDQTTGSEYGPAAWASCGDKKPSFVTTDREGYPVVRVGEDGEITTTEMAEIRKYWKDWKKARALMGVGKEND